MEDSTILSLCFPSAQVGGPVDENTTKMFQQLCEEQGRVNQCQATLNVVANSSDSSATISAGSTSSTAAPTKALSLLDTRQPYVVYNITLSGPYQNVMLARGAFLRNSPLKPRLSIPVSRSLIYSNVNNAGAAQAAGDSGTEAGAYSIPATGSPSIGNGHSVHADTQSPSLQASATDDDGTPKSAPEDSKLNDGKTSSSAPPFTVLPRFKAAVDEISAATRTSITLLSSPTCVFSSTFTAVAGFSRQDMVELHVIGTWENAEAARLLLLVAIDALKPGVVADKLGVELKFQNMIGGRKRQDLQELMAKTSTSIYLTSSLVQTANKSGTPVDSRYNDIYITGETKQVAVAKDALSRAYRRAQAASVSCTRQVNIATRKLDWMLLNHREKLRSIMTDNATFIAFPPLGGTHFTISVYGESNVNVERTIRTVMQLSCQFHSGSITMRDLGPPIHFPQTLSSFANVCKLVSQASGAEVEYRNNGFSMFGSEIQTRMAMQFLTEVDMVKAFHSEFKFSVELANEHREFISGKKNGKINRIMKVTGAKIKFDQCNEYNFYVDLSSSIAMKAMEALLLLQEELPAEISFFVPETYHKRIIGVGGKNIQRIMKKYGVYVKFSNSEEFATLGGYFDNLDNVVARTPSKNAVNLDNLKQAVMEMVSAKDKDFVSHRLLILKQQHLSLLSDQAATLKEIHEATNASVLFPSRETGSDIVVISGPESLIQQATAMLLSLVDERYTLLVKFTETMGRVLALPEFQTNVVEQMKRAWNMTLVLPEVTDVTPSADQQLSGQGGNHGDSSQPKESDKENRLPAVQDDHVFVFEYTRNNEDHLQEATDLLSQFLVDHHIEVRNDEVQLPRPRASSFGESLVHFHSRTGPYVAYELASAQGSTEYTLFDATSNGSEATPGNGGVLGSGCHLSSDIRSIFTPSAAQGLPSLDTSSSRWSDHSRHLSAFAGSPSSQTSVMSASGSAFGLGQSPNSSLYGSRASSSPVDPWAPSKHQQRPTQSSAGYLGSVGDLRSGLPGYYSPGTYSPSQQASVQAQEAAFNKVPGFQTPAATNHRYSGENSPVQGTTAVGNFGTTMGHQVSTQHGTSQRPSSTGSSGNRSSMSYYDDKMLSGVAFGAGYGPSLNSGSGRTQQQQMGYQQQSQYGQQHQSLQPYPQHQQQQPLQQGFASQMYAPHLHLQQGLSYPQQRQRHSSQNSAASHHTMGLGPIGGGPGSAGGSVNSDETSTEDDSDDVFDEMRNRQRMQSTPLSLLQHSQTMSQGYHHPSAVGSGLEGYLPHNSSSSSLLNRRGSAGSTHSVGFQQQQQQQQLYSQKPLEFTSHLSNGNFDLYGQNALVSAMEKHSLNSSVENDASAAGRSSHGRFGKIRSRQSSGTGMTSFAPGSRFDDDRGGFFSSGFGGIIGEGAHGYGQTGTSASGISSGSMFGTHTQAAAFGNFGGSNDNAGLNSDGKAGGLLSSSNSAFYMDSALRLGQSTDTNESGHALGWDR
ncbi:hypothetical protein EDD11_005418 [Mortierella claussenii]|nr:hypothetical protein EDD11_005418 [Mortierella claussenii]